MLECSICYKETFNFESIFNCSKHIICDDCLEEWISTFIDKIEWEIKIRCPICRAYIKPHLLDEIEEVHGLL